MTKIYAAGWAATVAFAVLGTAHAQDPKVQRGRYMVLTGHCNNCHTAAGAPAQSYLPPGQEPKPPYIQYPMPAK